MKRDKYDAVVSDLIRAIHKYTCESCGKYAEGQGMHCAHIFGRRHAGTRYDLDNVLCLCATCHRKYSENPVDFTNWLNDYKGVEHVERIGRKAWTVKKWAPGEKEKLYKTLRRQLSEVEG